jgi:hypothetical protein
MLSNHGKRLDAMNGEQLRDGIFALKTRRFGSVAEVLVQRLLKIGKGKSLFHDLFDDVENHRVEVKFSVVHKKAEIPITEATVLDAVRGATSEERMVKFEDWQHTTFDCNIQQVKRAEFDILYYGLFFSDCIVVFRIQGSEIGPQIQYSDRQHKGNVGEGQFHINRRTMQVHLDRYYYRKLTYDELLDLLTA